MIEKQFDGPLALDLTVGLAKSTQLQYFDAAFTYVEGTQVHRDSTITRVIAEGF
jgi:hypothetical protein